MTHSNRFPLLVATLLTISAATAVTGDDKQGPFLPMDKSLVPLNSQEGRRLLAESKAQEPYWNLTQYFSPQPDLGSCSVASCTMVLNALPIERPVSGAHKPFKLYTPENFFTDKVEVIAARKKVSASGMTLGQLAQVLGTFPVKVECVHASDSTAELFRKRLKVSLSGSDEQVIVNYLRRSLGQESGGHISPIAAFNEAADMVLVLDTANYKYPWTWVKVDDLWKAMAEYVDSESKKSRGYVVVTAQKK